MAPYRNQTWICAFKSPRCNAKQRLGWKGYVNIHGFWLSLNPISSRHIGLRPIRKIRHGPFIFSVYAWLLDIQSSAPLHRSTFLIIFLPFFGSPWSPNPRFLTTMRPFVSFTALALLASATSATRLSDCSTNSTTPCGCPAGTAYAESVTFATIGAKATDVKALIGSCSSPTFSLLW